MNSSCNIYLRVLKYARPYTWRLAVGILGGLLAGGSIFGGLMAMPDAFRPFSNQSAKAPAVAGTEAAAAAPREAVPDTTGAATATPAAAAEDNSPFPKWARKLAARYNIPTSRPDGSMTWQVFVLSVIALPLLFLLKGVASYLNRYFMSWVGARVVMDLRNDLFGSLQRQSMQFFGKRDIGELISRCTNDTAVIQRTIAATIADLTKAPAELLGTVGFIVYFSLKNDFLGLVVALAVVFPLCFLPIIVMGRYVKQFTRQALSRVSEVVSRMQENFTCIRIVKAFNMEAAETERFQRLNRGHFRSIMKALRAELLMTPLVESVAVIFICGLLIFCYAQHIQITFIAPMVAAAIMSYRPVKELAKVNVSIQTSLAAAERVFELIDANSELPEAANPVRKESFDKGIVFDHVSFFYEQTGLKVLDDVCLEIAKGQVIACVGETGAGKTTMANLLARFYDPGAGRILMDGVDLRELETASLRRLIGIVPQESVLFNESIAYNIAYAKPGCGRAEIEEAARKANAHEFIMREAEGYERVVGEKGCLLSGGQRQRLAIARVLLKNAPILILDEATSALDTATEKLVQEAIRRAMADRTSFVIAHRLSTVQHADLILVMDQGRIIERGTHGQLYAAGGAYRRLCDMQFAIGGSAETAV